MNLLRFRSLLMLLVLLWQPAALAHSFGAGTDAFVSFLNAVSIFVSDPILLLPSISLGILAAAYKTRGLVDIWPWLFGSHLVGFLTASLVGDWVNSILLVVGLAVATIAALVSKPAKILVISSGVITGVLTMLVSLQGHAWHELSMSVYVGLFAGASMGVVISSGIAEVALEKLPEKVSKIALRVAASWLAAIQLLAVMLLIA
ncbi:hypothetical protein [Marinobacterium sp. LSUCC0821]|uniref:hypothetical protein n=1 Tax=Marinobacterium sp. LSUCC0821 TaxID=2668067 RepID=UPI0014523012|nr:hypothetical protein [Marinobacterium sp. LSUCC0821]QJD71994.1 hypothetical protein HH196_09945 [Marinobacterium sp. LSUCC0821]